jgi:GLPGLI family protein
MYKIKVSVFLILIVSLKTNAQIKNYKITYRHCFQYDTTLKLLDTIGFAAILIGTDKETSYSFAKASAKDIAQRANEKTLEEIMKSKQEGSFKLKTGEATDSFGNMVYYNKVKDSVFIREKMINQYIVTDEVAPKINWKITTGEKKIKNYNCQKAITRFRGRNYTAWFTTDIAIVAAPWKFFGLPGLIMSIEDDRKQVKIYVEKIDYPSKEVVQEFINKGKKISIKEYCTFRNEEYKHNSKAIQTALDNQEHMQEIIKSGEARPVVKMIGAPYSIEIRLD